MDIYISYQDKTLYTEGGIEFISNGLIVSLTYKTHKYTNNKIFIPYEDINCIDNGNERLWKKHLKLHCCNR